MALTLSTIRQFIQDRSNENTSARGVRIQNRIANAALHNLHAAGDWDFDQGLVRLAFAASKSDGTVSVSAGATSLVGVGTAFAAADLDKYFRLSGEGLQYRVTAAPTDPLAATIETYLEAAAASGVSYVLTQDRLALPARFRKVLIEQDTHDVCGLREVTLSQLMDMRMHERGVGLPAYCAFDGGSDPSNTDGVPGSKYFWVYPSPSSAFAIQIPCYLKPVEMTSDSHGISAPYEAEQGYLELVKAEIADMEGKTDVAQAKLALAYSIIGRDLARFRARARHPQKETWDPDVDDDQSPRTKTVLAADGETF